MRYIKKASFKKMGSIILILLVFGIFAYIFFVNYFPDSTQTFKRTANDILGAFSRFGSTATTSNNFAYLYQGIMESNLYRDSNCIIEIRNLNRRSGNHFIMILDDSQGTEMSLLETSRGQAEVITHLEISGIRPCVIEGNNLDVNQLDNLEKLPFYTPDSITIGSGRLMDISFTNSQGQSVRYDEFSTYFYKPEEGYYCFIPLIVYPECRVHNPKGNRHSFTTECETLISEYPRCSN